MPGRNKLEDPLPPAHEDYIPHAICPRCSLILSRDLCVCGWRRPTPRGKRRQTDWVLRAVAAVAVLVILGWLISHALVES